MRYESRGWSGGWLALSIGMILAVSIILWRSEAAPMADPWDVFILLGEAWRISIGQVPHSDFHNPIGSLTYLFGTAGILASGPSLVAVSRGTSLFLLCLVPAAIHLNISKRLSGPNTFVFVLFLALVASSPRPLGFPPEITSYAMLYNRYGWVLLGILTVQLALAPVGLRDNEIRIDDVSTGVLLGLLFFCKVNYFLAGVLLTTCAVFGRWSRWRWGRVAWLFGGFAIVCIVMRLVADINAYSYLADIVSATAAQSRWDRADRLVSGVEANALNVAMTLATSVVASVTGRRHGRSPSEMLVIAALVGFAAILVTVGNTGEGNQLPLFFVGGLVAWQWCLPRSCENGRLPSAVSALAVVAGIVFLAAPLVADDVLAHAAAAQYRSSQSDDDLDVQSFGADSLKDFYVPPETNRRTAYWRSRDVPRVIREGVELLRHHASPETRVFTVALTDPFSFALGLPPPRGVPLWWDLNLSFNGRNHPDARQVFADVDFVMVPNLRDSDDGCCKSTVRLMLELYGAHLRDHFIEVGRSDHWTILRRVSARPEASSGL